MPKKRLTKNHKHDCTQKSNAPYLCVYIFFFGIDQLLKHIALFYPEHTSYVWQPWIGWELFKNPGVAFGIPIPNSVLIIGTPLLVGILFYIKKYHSKKIYTMPQIAISLIITGAASNFFDRIVYKYTVDYLRIGTSIMNLADILIVIGATILIIYNSKKHNQGGICSPKSIPPLLSD